MFGMFTVCLRMDLERRRVALETETPHRAVGNNITPELDMWQVVQETILERLGRLQRQHLAVYSIISVWF